MEPPRHRVKKLDTLVSFWKGKQMDDSPPQFPLKSRTILVGNGSSSKGAKRGAKINQFGTVVRFNWFWIKGHEVDVGNGVDVWFTSVHSKPHFDENNFRFVWCHTWTQTAPTCKTYNLLRQHHPLVFKTEHQVINEMVEFAKLPKRYNFSTGAIAAWYFAKLLKETITVTGFDWALSPRERGKHHYGDDQRKGNIHEPAKEYDFFQRMQAENYVRIL